MLNKSTNEILLDMVDVLKQITDKLDKLEQEVETLKFKNTTHTTGYFRTSEVSNPTPYTITCSEHPVFKEIT